MTYYVVKTAYGYFHSTKGRYKICYSSNAVSAKHYLSKKAAEKRAEVLNGEVMYFDGNPLNAKFL